VGLAGLLFERRSASAGPRCPFRAGIPMKSGGRQGQGGRPTRTIGSMYRLDDALMPLSGISGGHG